MPNSCHAQTYNSVLTQAEFDLVLLKERENRFLTAHQHKNRPFSAIRGKNRSKWDNHVNYGKYLTTFNVISKEV